VATLFSFDGFLFCVVVMRICVDVIRCWVYVYENVALNKKNIFLYFL